MAEKMEKTEKFQFRLDYLTFVTLGTSRRVKNPGEKIRFYANLCGSSVLTVPPLYEKKHLKLFDKTVEQIVNACDSRGYINVTPSLRQTVFAYRAKLDNVKEEGETERLLLVRTFTYRKIKDNAFVYSEFEDSLNVRNILFQEYITLGKPKSIEELISSTITLYRK